jgi:hypothetical protein
MVPIFFHLLIDTFNRIRAASQTSSRSGSGQQHHDEQRLGRILIQSQNAHLISVLRSSVKTKAGGGGTAGGGGSGDNQKLFSSFLETCVIWSSLAETSLLKNSGALSLVDIDQCRVNVFSLLEESSSHGLVPSVMELVSHTSLTSHVCLIDAFVDHSTGTAAHETRLKESFSSSCTSKESLCIYDRSDHSMAELGPHN